jgi:hypothetical protein
MKYLIFGGQYVYVVHILCTESVSIFQTYFCHASRGFVYIWPKTTDPVEGQLTIVVLFMTTRSCTFPLCPSHLQAAQMTKICYNTRIKLTYGKMNCELHLWHFLVRDTLTYPYCCLKQRIETYSVSEITECFNLVKRYAATSLHRLNTQK